MDEEHESTGELELRVARVEAAERHSNADRLLVLQIDLGTERRQIVAGLVGHYQPEELVGKQLVVVANLEPARLRGETSQGMLLAAENEQGELGILLAPSAAPGTRVAPDPPPEVDDRITFDEFRTHELIATVEGVTQNGRPLLGPELVMDRAVYGRLR